MVPRGIGRMNSLHTLQGVNLHLSGGILRDIRGLTGLRKLGMVGLEEKNASEFFSVVSSLNLLESLSVGRNLRLDGVSSPPSNLRNLKLDGDMPRLPEWVKKLENLVKLKLRFRTSSQVEQDDAIRALGNLPNLAVLRLSVSLFKGEELHFGTEAFQSLIVLDLLGTRERMKLVEFEQGAMPKLQQLLVRYSENNKEIRFLGLDSLGSIKEVGTELPSLGGGPEDERIKEQFRTQLALNRNKPMLNILGWS